MIKTFGPAIVGSALTAALVIVGAAPASADAGDLIGSVGTPGSASPLSADLSESVVSHLPYALSFLDGPIGEPDYSDPTTHIVVIANHLGPDRQMGERLLNRMIAAEAEAKAHPEVPILLTGGDTMGLGVPESHVMRQWLIDHGIAPERITVEDRSWTTVSNVAFTHDLIPEVTSLVLVAPDDKQRNIAADFAAIFGPSTTITAVGPIQPPVNSEQRDKVIGDLAVWYLAPVYLNTEGSGSAFGPSYGPPGRLRTRITEWVEQNLGS